MSPEELENELIKIFTNSNVNWHFSARGKQSYYVRWTNYDMWLFRGWRVDINNYSNLHSSSSFNIPKIPTKALAILAITCRPAYEFYKKNWT